MVGRILAARYWVCYMYIMYHFPFSALTMLVGQQEWQPARKKKLGVGLLNWVLVCWWWKFDWSFACLIAPVVTTTSIILSSNKIQNGDILALANPGPPGKRPLKWRERNADVQSYTVHSTVLTGVTFDQTRHQDASCEGHSNTLACTGQFQTI